MKTKLRKLATVISIVIAVIAFSQDVFAQAQRNPVLEEFTGTWCQWCPCGHTIMQQIKNAYPNVILIGYHGPINGSDPFSYFSGNSIITSFSVPYWPSGTVDRSGALGDRGTWTSWVNSRNNIPATVAINVNRSYNRVTREFNASIDFTALNNLNGHFRFHVILLESGIVWYQQGNGSCPGSPTYVHKHVVRDMINGAGGTEIINGIWNQNQVITKTVNRVVPHPGGSGPDIIPDSCDIVVIAYKVGSTLATSEIQQAKEMTLIPPDYVAKIAASSPDVIISNNAKAELYAVIYNQGLMPDTYDITTTLDGPAGWTGDFTTINGTYPFGETNAVQVVPGDSTVIFIEVYPNSFNGSGVVTVDFVSQNNPGVLGSINFGVVTNTGVHLLVVDGTGEGHASKVSNVLDGFYQGRYGVVNRNVFQLPNLDLSYFTMIAWSSGNSKPAFYPGEIAYLKDYLDMGGNLLINGQNIGADIFEPGGQSQFAQSFFNNYLHSNYLANFGGSFYLSGIAGDPITNGVTTFSLNSVYTMSPDEISPFDANTNAIIQFGGAGPKINSVRSNNGIHKVVHFGFAFEQLSNNQLIDTLVARSVRWLTEGIVLDNSSDATFAKSYILHQNYPNPFNPATLIAYSIAEETQVSLKVYDIMGSQVAELVNARQPAGNYKVGFDASALASGTYVYKLTAGDFISVKKMVLLK